VREDIARHYDNIARMDTWVGEVLQLLEDDGLAEKTVVFFWSDHGDGLPRAKRWLYDSGIHVPLIVRWPGRIEPGSVNNELTSFVDLAPSVLSLAGAPVPRHMHGRALLGDSRQEPPNFIFAARDRHDESYDRVRAVRDKRFKYLRNYYPEKPYILWLPYRNRMPTMQELLRTKAEGTSRGPVATWLRDQRDPEELYDVEADPHEIKNLAGDPDYKRVLTRMRKALLDWETTTGDMGRIPESQMVRDMWPNGIQPETSSPVILLTSTEHHQSPVRTDTVSLGVDSTIELHSSTEGASLVWTTDAGDRPHWMLYTTPLRFASSATLRAKAVRYGFRESQVVQLTVAVFGNLEPEGRR
jgi:hypothetical protein